eukprot:5777426-Prymnesium_polylepis.1
MTLVVMAMLRRAGIGARCCARCCARGGGSRCGGRAHLAGPELWRAPQREPAPLECEEVGLDGAQLQPAAGWRVGRRALDELAVAAAAPRVELVDRRAADDHRRAGELAFARRGGGYGRSSPRH